MSEVHTLLSRLPGFAPFSEQSLRALVKIMTVEEHPDGTELTTQGTPGRACHLLLEGRVTITRTDELTGQEQALKELSAGELFGILSLLERLPAAATCTARGPVRTAALPRSDYRLLFKVDAPLAYHFQWLVAQQLARDLRARNQTLREQLLSQ